MVIDRAQAQREVLEQARLDAEIRFKAYILPQSGDKRVAELLPGSLPWRRAGAMTNRCLSHRRLDSTTRDGRRDMEESRDGVTLAGHADPESYACSIAAHSGVEKRPAGPSRVIFLRERLRRARFAACHAPAVRRVAATSRSAPDTALVDPVAGIEQRRIRVAEPAGAI